MTITQTILPMYSAACNSCSPTPESANRTGCTTLPCAVAAGPLAIGHALLHHTQTGVREWASSPCCKVESHLQPRLHAYKSASCSHAWESQRCQLHRCLHACLQHCQPPRLPRQHHYSAQFCCPCKAVSQLSRHHTFALEAACHRVQSALMHARTKLHKVHSLLCSSTFVPCTCKDTFMSCKVRV